MEDQIAAWLSHYGYGAALPAVLADPAGIPWAWIFLMILAQKAGRNIVVLLLIGFVTLWACDLILYWVGKTWGTKLLAWLQKRRPQWKETLENAGQQMNKKGALAVIVGRYLPLVGRWVGLASGMARLPFSRFAVYSAIGASLSAFGFGIPAYLLGREIVDNPLWMQVALGICVVGSVIGLVGGCWTAWRAKSHQTPA